MYQNKPTCDPRAKARLVSDVDPPVSATRRTSSAASWILRRRTLLRRTSLLFVLFVRENQAGVEAGERPQRRDVTGPGRRRRMPPRLPGHALELPTADPVKRPVLTKRRLQPAERLRVGAPARARQIRLVKKRGGRLAQRRAPAHRAQPSGGTSRTGHRRECGKTYRTVATAFHNTDRSDPYTVKKSGGESFSQSDTSSS